MDIKPEIEKLEKTKVFGKIPLPYVIFGGGLALAGGAWYYTHHASSGDGGLDNSTADDTTATGYTQGSGNPKLTGATPDVSGDNDSGLTNNPDNTTASPVTATTYTDNQAWLQAAISYEVAKGVDVTTATNALSQFINGASLTYQQGVIRDDAVKGIGVPPQPVGITTDTYNGPAVKQGVPPLTHKVIGSSDNTPAELALLYYGNSSASYVSIIKSGGNTADVYAVGDLVNVPALPAGQATTAPLYTLPTNTSPNIVTSPTTVAPVTSAPLVTSAGPLLTGSKDTTSVGSVNNGVGGIQTAPTVPTGTTYAVNANENMSSFQARVMAQYGFVPSIKILTQLNPSKPTTLADMNNNAKHAANELRIA